MASFETSLYDDKNQKRADFGLASLFGVSYGSKIDTQLHNSYLNIEKNPADARAEAR